MAVRDAAVPVRQVALAPHHRAAVHAADGGVVDLQGGSGGGGSGVTFVQSKGPASRTCCCPDLDRGPSRPTCPSDPYASRVPLARLPGPAPH